MSRTMATRWTSCFLLYVVWTALPQSIHGHPAGDRSAGGAAKTQENASSSAADFCYDPADELVAGQVLENPEWYEADVTSINGVLHYTWLEFTPGEGDRIWIASQSDASQLHSRLAVETFGAYARPTLSVTGDGQVWLSYEAEQNDQWDLLAIPLIDGRPAGEPRRISPGAGGDIRHRVAGIGEGLWFVWQSDRGGQFDIMARRATSTGLDEPQAISSNPRGDWHPHVAAGADGSLHVVWDAYDGRSYNIEYRTRRDGQWQPPRTIAGSDRFEGRAQVAVDQQDRVWIAWEEGEQNWGAAYRGITYDTMTDQIGPLHRFRSLRLAVITPTGAPADGDSAPAGRSAGERNATSGISTIPYDPPQPSISQAAERPGRAEGISRSGVFYERPRLAVDRAGRVWIAYRHFYAPWLGVKHRGHVEAGWGVYARHVTPEGWSRLYHFDVGQGDGLQSLELASHRGGIAAVWTTGRTDRRMNSAPSRPQDSPAGPATLSKKNPPDAASPAPDHGRHPHPRGTVTAYIEGQGAALGALDPAEPLPLPEAKTEAAPANEPNRPAVQYGKTRYRLFFGDLHRHTDLSLCRVPTDGTIDDAYRYAIDVAGLDFLGITDHSRDIARGDALSQLWWRSSKQVQRHQLGTRFIPFFAYERSHDHTADHNVISLRRDMLRPHTYPVPEFWKELDENTITIPHQPIRRDTWKYQNDRLRPLLEIFQGCRDHTITQEAHEGLGLGYHLGFIASSDHASTSASYACVWAENADRESIFRALKARRTYGATARIQLRAHAGPHAMGEIVRADHLPPLSLEVIGTAPVRRVHLIVSGAVRETIVPNKQHVSWEPRVELSPGEYVYFHVVQGDGNEAWSSPIWLEE